MHMYLYTSGGKFYADGGLGFQIELIPCEAGEEVTFANAGVPNQNHWNKIEEKNVKLIFN